jgi:hypothetical protein
LRNFGSNGQLRRRKKRKETRGLNENCNHDLKDLFKGAAVVASIKPGPFASLETLSNFCALVSLRPTVPRKEQYGKI